MRTVFMQWLFDQAAIDPSIYLLVGDVGFSVIEKFAAAYPQRYINTGIAEQNMIGVAAGLAMTGKKVYVYSIIPFVTLRCFEQVRDDLCYQQLPVTIVGVGGGFSYGPMGVTHHAIEDVAIMRSLPEMTVVAPGSKHEIASLMPALHALKLPAYIRLSNNEELITYAGSQAIELGKAIEIVPHDDTYIVASGNALDLGWQVQQHLSALDISIGLVSMPTIKPLDINFFTHKKLHGIFTIEEHLLIGGLGEAVGSVLSQALDYKVIFHAFGVDDFYYHETGSRAYLKERAGLSVENVSSKIIGKLKK